MSSASSPAYPRALEFEVANTVYGLRVCASVCLCCLSPSSVLTPTTASTVLFCSSLVQAPVSLFKAILSWGSSLTHIQNSYIPKENSNHSLKFHSKKQKWKTHQKSFGLGLKLISWPINSVLFFLKAIWTKQKLQKGQQYQYHYFSICTEITKHHG